MTQTPLILCERLNDGHLQMKRSASYPAWREVSQREEARLLGREMARAQASHEWAGKWKGKTVIILGCGPQLRRFSPVLLEYLSTQEDIVLIGVNAVPAILDKMFGLDPNEILDAVVAADAVHAEFYEQWGWKELRIPKFRKKCFYVGKEGDPTQPDLFPIVNANAPSDNILTLFYVDSISCAINLAVIGMASETFQKRCGGPKRQWTITRTRKSEGKILLVGVEHNDTGHAYTGEPDFFLYDNPGGQWKDMARKKAEHRRVKKFAADMGVELWNTAPWNDLKVYDVRHFSSLVSGPGVHEVSALPAPRPRTRLYHRGECAAYRVALRNHLEHGAPKPEKPKRIYPGVVGSDPIEVLDMSGRLVTRASLLEK